MLNSPDYDPEDEEVLDDDEPEAPAGGGRLVLWLVVVSLSLLFVTLFMVSATIRDNQTALETEFAEMALTLTATPEPRPQEEALRTEFARVMEQLGALQPVQTEISAAYLNWPEAMRVLGDFDVQQMTLTGFSRSDDRIMLAGQANDESIAMRYVERLRQSGQFGDVLLQEINLHLLPTPTSLPTMAPDSTAEPLAVMISGTPLDSFAEFTIAITLKAEVTPGSS